MGFDYLVTVAEEQTVLTANHSHCNGAFTHTLGWDGMEWDISMEVCVYKLRCAVLHGAGKSASRLLPARYY